MKLVSQFPALSAPEPAEEHCNWEFKLLRDIEILGKAPYSQARLIYEDDACGAYRAILCSGRVFKDLEPYAADLLAWRNDPLAHEQPVIPIAHGNTGSPRFCPEGAARIAT